MKQSISKNRSAMLPIFFTVFLDLLGLGIVIPILPAVLLNPVTGILPMEVEYATRTIIYGFLVAAYPLAQLFSSPILGALADQKGRKKILMISLFGTFLGYLIFAIGIYQKNISLLFLGRIIDGLTGGNITIAQSAISDISDEKNKTRNFGMIGMAFGLGFILGPYVGGKLSDPSIVSWFNLATPFYLSMALSLVNILLVALRFPETLKFAVKARISLLTGLVNLKKAFQYKSLRIVFLVSFLLAIGFNFFTQFFQVLLVDKFSFSQSEIGDFFAYMGLWIAITQGMILRPMSMKFKPVQILKFSMIFLAATFPFLLLPEKAFYIYLIIPFVAIFQGMTQPNTTTLVSNMAGDDEQGEILGVNQSIQSAAQAIPAIIAGYVTAVNINLPTLFAAGTTFVAWLVFRFIFLRKKKLEADMQ